MLWVVRVACLPLRRYPWLLPLLGFAAGWLSFVLVQRGTKLATLIAMSVLAGWLWLLIQPFVRLWLSRYGSTGMSNMVVNFVAQSIQQETLFFALPFLYFSTEFNDPGQVLVTALVLVAALLTTLDPVYERVVAKRYSTRLAFHCLCSIVATLVVLPIVIRMPLEKVTPVALGFVLLWLVLVLSVRWVRREPVLPVMVIALVLPLLLWGARAHIPPAGIQVREAVVARSMENLRPVDDVRQVTLADLKNGLYLFASISAPMGLTQDVVFLWRHGAFSERISASITGGRTEGYRTYSHKRNFSEDPVGEWVVDILTPQGQLLDRVMFTVEPDAVAPGSGFMQQPLELPEGNRLGQSVIHGSR